MDAYIGLDGYMIPSGYVIKELTVMFPNSEYNHYLFQPPAKRYLTETDKRTVRFASHHLNNLAWFDGDIPYEQLDHILAKLRDYKIYTFSEIAVETLQRALPTSVIINVQDMGFKMPNALPDSHCGRIHNFRYCSKAKVCEIKKFIEDRI